MGDHEETCGSLGGAVYEAGLDVALGFPWGAVLGAIFMAFTILLFIVEGLCEEWADNGFPSVIEGEWQG